MGALNGNWPACHHATHLKLYKGLYINAAAVLSRGVPPCRSLCSA